MNRENFFFELERRNVDKAQVYVVRGEADKALEWSQISLDDHDGGTLNLSVDPLLRGLHDDPRYKNLLAKLGLPTT